MIIVYITKQIKGVPARYRIEMNMNYIRSYILIGYEVGTLFFLEKRVIRKNSKEESKAEKVN